MMPMAGQDAVLDAASFQRETHMRAPIVEREDLSALVYEQDGAVAAVHNNPTFAPQLFKSSGAHEIRGRVIHRRLLRNGPPQCHSAGVLLACQSIDRRLVDNGSTPAQTLVIEPGAAS